MSIRTMLSSEADVGDGVVLVDSLQNQAVGELKAKLEDAGKTRTVRLMRVAMLVFLFLAAVLVCAGLYLYATSQEKHEFETAFETNALKLLDSFSSGVEQNLEGLGAMGTALTAHALGNPQVEFPFFTFPSFEVLGAQVRVQARSPILHWGPLVTNEKRSEWEEWALQNRFHADRAYQQDLNFRQTQDDYFASLRGNRGDKKDDHNDRFLVEEGENQTSISIVNNTVQDGSRYQYRIASNGKNPKPLPADFAAQYFPRWQQSPVRKPTQGPLNRDLAVFPPLKETVARLLQDPKVIIGPSYQFPDPNVGFNENLLLSQYRNSITEYVGEPLSYIVYPVFDAFYNSSASLAEQKTHLAGLLYTNIYWRLLLKNVLPSNLNGIICVVENSYNDTFSYRVDGPDVTFLGNVDPYELYQEYEDIGLVEQATAYVQSRAKPETRSYTSVPLHDSYGLYTLRVYPSRDTEVEFSSNLAVVFVLVVAVVFVVTVVNFGVFNLMVERRQRIVRNEALQSGALVNSLFPEKVQKRLYSRQSTQRMDSAASMGVRTVPLEQDNSNSNKPDLNTSGRIAADSSPIADHYEEVTIMFADLAGFTKWSSNRSPCDVFVLLETLYNSFDVLATRQKVFKVETIGDCYLACCGLPEPNPHHAQVMARFASACMVKMSMIVGALSDQLGKDTAALQLRAGLHSGSVTAGVLRGQKSRFQLFGDTVNTASRMESNGLPGRIHASEETAERLIAAGKSSWVSKRVDKITAKGKGELQTYWIAPKTEGSTTSSTTTSTSSSAQPSSLVERSRRLLENAQSNQAVL